MDDGATALHDGLHHGRKSTVMRGESLCVITATRLLLLIYIDFLFLEVSHLIFLLLSLSLYFFPFCLSSSLVFLPLLRLSGMH